MSKAKVEQKLTTLLTVFTIIVLFWGQIGQSYLALGGAKLRKSSKVEFMGANSDFGGVEMVPVPPVLAQIIQNEPRWAKLALKKLGPIWLLGSIWLFSIYSVGLPRYHQSCSLERDTMQITHFFFISTFFLFRL